MHNRTWDKNGHYREGIIKEFEHWILEVSYKQHTLGSYIIFARREIENIRDLNLNEFDELKKVMIKIETALENIKAFSPDKFNYWQMGNSLSRLHFHGIPRYKNERFYGNRVWIDPTWGSIPTWNKKEENREIIRLIRDDIFSEIEP